MPRMSAYVTPSVKPSYDENVETVWLKPADLAKDGTHFCIESVSKGKNPDDFGNFHWYLSIILEDHPIGTRYLLKFLVNGGKRDAHLEKMQRDLAQAAAQGDDDRYVHGCEVVALPPQKKGHQPYMHLTNHDSPICACGYGSDSPADKEAKAAYSETVPF